jgi:beta-hydroxylase
MSMAGGQALGGAAGKSGWKAWRRAKVKGLGNSVMKALGDIYSRQSLVPDLPVIPNHHFPFLAEFEANWQTIRAELEVLLKDRESIPFMDQVSPDQARISHSQKWRVFFLWGLGDEVTGNTAKCPQTAALLRKVPGLRSAWFSILAPFYKIKPHRGITKGIVRSHLGLIVPANGERCRMWVDDVKFHWHEGKCVTFDDSRRHRVLNSTEEERVVLLFDYDRPMRWPASALHRLTMGLIKRTAYYKDARKNLKRRDRDDAITETMQRIAD